LPTPARPAHNAVGLARLTRGQPRDHRLFEQVTAKCEDLAKFYQVRGMIIPSLVTRASHGPDATWQSAVQPSVKGALSWAHLTRPSVRACRPSQICDIGSR
jgi:hypothetical protein